MNPDIRPQDDLFGHVNGRWLEETEIPSDRSSWGPFVQLADVAEEQVRVIIEDLAAAEPSKLSESGAKINALFTRSEEHTSELQSLMRISYAVFCLKKKNMK